MNLRFSPVVVLSLLLLSLQLQVLVHPIVHLAKEPKLQEPAFTSTHGGESCVECSLLVGGVTAVPATSPPVALRAAPVAFVSHSYFSRAAEVPAWFHSRAPPTLL